MGQSWGRGMHRPETATERRPGAGGLARAGRRASVLPGAGLAMQTASFLYGNEEFRLMELNHL